MLPIYIIQVSPDSNIGNLLKINILNYLKIAWEKIKNNDITQCYKCQRIDHIAQNCNLNYRCVKCTEPHGPGECKIKKEVAVSKEKIYCVNCTNFGHPASYKGCPKLAELRKKLNEKIIKAKTTKTERIAQISRKYVPELKFADIVKQGTSVSQTSPQVTNIAARGKQNPNPTADIPQLSIVNVIEDFKKNLLKALSDQQTQPNEIKKALNTHEERIDSIFKIIENIDED